MTTNKTIVKGLALGLLATNIPVILPVEATSGVKSSEDRFKTLEGETITINNSTHGSFKLVEIQGNSIQSAGNVKGVGDLYVDSKGSPILNIKGEKQYKIDLTTTDRIDEVTKTIFIDKPLMKIGDHKDRLYWNSSLNKYVIERSIMSGKFEDMFKGAVNINDLGTHIDFSISYDFYGADLIMSDYTVKSSSNKNTDSKGIYADVDTVGISIPKSELDSFDEAGLNKWLKNNETNVYFVAKDKNLMPANEVLKTETRTNYTVQIEMPTFDNSTDIYISPVSGTKGVIVITADVLGQIATQAVELAEANKTSENISIARMHINQLPESLFKDSLQSRLDNLFPTEDIKIDRKTVTANLDVYLKSENSLALTLDTNSIIFEEVTTVADIEKENAVTLSIKSSLPYEVNSYLVNEIQNPAGSVTVDKSILNIKANKENDYKAFNGLNSKLNLLDNQPAGNNIYTGIDMRVKGDLAFEADVYKTTVKFEVAQK